MTNFELIDSATSGEATGSDNRQAGRDRALRSSVRRAPVLRWVALAQGVAVAAIGCTTTPSERASVETTRSNAAALALGATQDFAVLAGSTVTNTGPTVVTADLGVSPGTAVTGFPPGLVNGGTIEAATARALQAQTDATTAYNALAGQACTRTLTGQDLGGLTLTPGTYCFSSSAGLTGTLTLDAQGDPAAAFVFQIGSTLTTASGSSVRVVNGGTFCDVYWQVGSSATLGTDTRFMGSIIALTSITMTTGASLSGRAVARNAAVTLDSNTISAASCRVELDGGTGGAVNSGGSGGLSAGGAAGAAGSGGGAGSGTGGASDMQGVGGTGATGSGAGGALGVAGSGAGGAANAGAGGGSSVGGAGAGGVGASDAGCSCDASCGCQAGTTSCEAKCVDLQTDSHHCGSCDRVCGASESCISGVCCSGSRATKP
jgi:hypothetical protein